MSNPLLIKQFVAGAAIAPFRIVSLSADNTVTQSSAAANLHIGVCGEVGPASGERVDVQTNGIAYAEAGAAITRGALLSSDANGRAITAAAAAGTNIRTIGIALDGAAAAGDIIRVLQSPGSFQG